MEALAGGIVEEYLAGRAATVRDFTFQVRGVVQGIYVEAQTDRGTL